MGVVGRGFVAPGRFLTVFIVRALLVVLWCCGWFVWRWFVFCGRKGNSCGRGESCLGGGGKFVFGGWLRRVIGLKCGVGGV